MMLLICVDVGCTGKRVFGYELCFIGGVGAQFGNGLYERRLFVSAKYRGGRFREKEFLDIALGVATRVTRAYSGAARHCRERI
jgi:hypothetical protein